MRSDDPPQRPRVASPGRGHGPALGVEVACDLPRAPLARGIIRRLALHVLRAERIPRAHLSVALVSPERIAQLNRRYVGHAAATDIVTLEHARGVAGAPVVGEIYIAPAVARENAHALGIPLRAEMARLVVHGVLHALGWEHPADARRTRSAMWKRQEALLRGARRAGVLNR